MNSWMIGGKVLIILWPRLRGRAAKLNYVSRMAFAAAPTEINYRRTAATMR
jgi:hypothetical protein